MAKDKDIIKEYDELYKQGEAEWNPFLCEAYKDTSVMLGNQWSDKDKKYLAQQGRNAYVFNKTRIIINQISGYQKRNRLASICQPREYQDYPSSDFITDLLMYIIERNSGYKIISEAFEGALVTGLNLLCLWMDYSKDPVNGEIKISREPYNSFLLDPQFTKLDLSDCGYVMRRRFVDKDTAKMLLPTMSSYIENLNVGKSDGKFNYMNYAKRDGNSGLLRYDEFWRRTTKKAHMIIDNRTGQTEIWKGAKSELHELKREFPFIKSKVIYKPTVELNIILEDELAYSEVDPYGTGDYPFVPVVGYYNAEYDNYSYKLQGVVRGLRDAQEEYNIMRSKASDIIKSQVNSGWMVREGSVKNPADLYRTGQGVVIERSIDSQPADVQKINPAELSQSFPVMIQDLENQIMALAGVSQELMGTAEGGNTEVSGVLAKQRAYNSVTTLQTLFDNLNSSQSILSRKIVKMALSNFTIEKAIRITNKEVPQEMLDMSSGSPKFNDDIEKYDIIVTETALTDTQKNLAYMQLLELKRAGIAIPDLAIIEAMPISDKGKLMEAYEQQEQQAQEQARKMEELEAINKKLNNAKIYGDVALAEERLSRSTANAGLAQERLSQARHDVSKAELNNLEIIEKMKSMRQEQLIQALDYVNSLQQQQINNDREYVEDGYQQSSVRVGAMIADQPQQEPQPQIQEGF